MDKFVENTGKDKCTGQPPLFGEPGLVMDYYDGNTVTALWNYAQHFALSDNSFNTVFGPSTPGAMNLISGQTHGVTAVDPKDAASRSPTPTPSSRPTADGSGTVTKDPDPAFDDCSDKNGTTTDALAAMSGKNIGDLLNAKNVTWGWFQGGFRPTATPRTARPSAAPSTPTSAASTSQDYSPHHKPFQYYQSTANPQHLAPTSVDADRAHRPGQPPVRPDRLRRGARRRQPARRSGS